MQMTAQDEKPCAVFVWAAAAHGTGGMNPSLRVNRERAVPGGRGPGMPGPYSEAHLVGGGVPDAPHGGTAFRGL